MKDKNILLTFLRPAAEAIIAILLLVSPEGFVKGIIVTFGLLLIIYGISCIVPYVRKISGASQEKMIFGAVVAVAGLMIAVCCNGIVSLISAIAVLYGIGLLIGAGGKVPQIIAGIGKGSAWIWDGIGMVVLIILGILALVNPFEAVAVLFKFIAAGLFLDAGFSLVAWFMIAKQK